MTDRIPANKDHVHVTNIDWAIEINAGNATEKLQSPSAAICLGVENKESIHINIPSSLEATKLLNVLDSMMSDSPTSPGAYSPSQDRYGSPDNPESPYYVSGQDEDENVDVDRLLEAPIGNNDSLDIPDQGPLQDDPPESPKSPITNPQVLPYNHEEDDQLIREIENIAEAEVSINQELGINEDDNNDDYNPDVYDDEASGNEAPYSPTADPDQAPYSPNSEHVGSPDENYALEPEPETSQKDKNDEDDVSGDEEETTGPRISFKVLQPPDESPSEDDEEVDAPDVEIQDPEPGEGPTAVKEMMGDIFGDSDQESDAEGEGFEGFDDDQENAGDVPDVEPELPDDAAGSSDEERRRVMADVGSGQTDFEKAMERQKRARQKRSSRRGQFYEDVTGGDDAIAALTRQMDEAVVADHEAMNGGKVAISKLNMLPEVRKMMQRVDLHQHIQEGGMLRSIALWLRPVGDGRTLPTLQVRTELLQLLSRMPPPSVNDLQASKIGKAVMLLARHPRETRSNRGVAIKLAQQWTRSVLQLDNPPTAEERLQLDERAAAERSLRRDSMGSNNSSEKKKAASASLNEVDESKPALRPGDEGYCYRARVPQPMRKDFTVRPRDRLTGGNDGVERRKRKGGDEMMGSSALKKKLSIVARSSTKKKRAYKIPSSISVEGRKMHSI